LKPTLSALIGGLNDNTHNFVLENLAETGLVGTALYLVPIALAFRCGAAVIRKPQPLYYGYLVASLLVGFGGSTVHGLFEVLHRAPQYTVVYWSVAACLL